MIFSIVVGVWRLLVRAARAVRAGFEAPRMIPAVGHFSPRVLEAVRKLRREYEATFCPECRPDHPHGRCPKCAERLHANGRRAV